MNEFTYKLNNTRITTWGWCDQSDGTVDGTVVQTHDSNVNSSPGGLKPSKLALGHAGSPQYRIITGKETFCFVEV